MGNLKGEEYLRRKLNMKKNRVNLRYNFYEMKDRGNNAGITIPAKLRNMYRSTMGWCGKAVDSLADRLDFREFKDDYFDMNGIFRMNNPDILVDSAVKSALISACSFIYIVPSDDRLTNIPRMRVIDGGNATGEIDDTTGLLKEGYAVLARSRQEPTLEAYFTPGAIKYTDKNQKKTWIVKNNAPYPLLVPIIHKPDARRPFGHSRISRACMYLQEAAKRTLERSEISAEFYSFPQRYLLGMDPDAEQLDKWEALVTSMLQIDKDEEGDSPTAGQFAQQSMSPYVEQIKAIASVFAGETGLTLDDLGFSTDNPSSSEAIKAAHESLRSTGKKAQKTFSSGLLNAGYLAACLRDDKDYRRSQIYMTIPKWNPLFEADFAALSGAGDSLIKIQQAFPDYLTEDKLADLLGI